VSNLLSSYVCLLFLCACSSWLDSESQSRFFSREIENKESAALKSSFDVTSSILSFLSENGAIGRNVRCTSSGVNLREGEDLGGGGGVKGRSTTVSFIRLDGRIDPKI
jgi:hypothetical protein